jgi:hypothetical protein
MGARILAWLAPHALSEIFPVHVAPKQDVASKAVTKVILDTIWNNSFDVRPAHGESVSVKGQSLALAVGQPRNGSGMPSAASLFRCRTP